MTEVLSRDVLLRFGGATLRRYGNLVVASGGIGRTEEIKESVVRADASTCATYIDRDGKMRLAEANVLRLDYEPFYSLGLTFPDGSPAFGPRFEGSRSNRILQSQNHGTTWAAVGTPTLVSGALNLGLLALDLVGDDSAVAGEGYQQTFTVTGADGVRPLSVYVAKATTPATWAYIGWFDQTAAAWRGLWQLTWNGTLPVLTKESGDAASLALTPQLVGFAAENLTLPIYRLMFTIGGVVVANTQRLNVYPSNVNNVAETGTLYVGGWQPENEAKLFPGTYIKTTTATVTRAAENVTVVTALIPRDMTVLARMAQPVWAQLSGDLGAVQEVFTLGGAGAGSIRGGGSQAVRNWHGFIDGSAADSNATTAMLAGASQIVSRQFKSFAAGGQAAIDVGAGLGGFASAATPFTNFTNQTLTVGGLGGSGELYGVLLDLVFLDGLFTKAEAEAYPA